VLLNANKKSFFYVATGKNLITASGVAPLEFGMEVLKN